MNAEDITVRSGEWQITSSNRNEFELIKHQDRLVKSISIHPRFSGNIRLFNDVALIHLTEEFELKVA